jgi:hypothetical protein
LERNNLQNGGAEVEEKWGGPDFRKVLKRGAGALADETGDQDH